MLPRMAGFQFLTDEGFYPWSKTQLACRMAAFPSLIEAKLNTQKVLSAFLLNRKYYNKATAIKYLEEPMISNSEYKPAF